MGNLLAVKKHLLIRPIIGAIFMLRRTKLISVIFFKITFPPFFHNA